MDSPPTTAPLTKLQNLLDLQPTYTASATISVSIPRIGRPAVSLLSPGRTQITTASRPVQQWFGTLGPLYGDAPDKLHPKFLVALLSSLPVRKVNQKQDGTLPPLPEWLVPKIEFNTDEFVRRSMTLNGMRMTTEYFGSGSPRVLQLVKQRLEAGQRDVVHDILVYLANQLIDVRAEAHEARMLRAEAIAAYLGLEQHRVEAIFQSNPLKSQRIARAIESGAAGSPRRTLNIESLVQSQVELVQPALQAATHAEKVALRMIDRIVTLLY